ncbi:hypothetical protein A3Q56_06344 [Intoshia linei]|uniref:Uncharacterized protein n=1 Tax=Intoshia linei TaxID=1819745 RepID=A0A177AX10_9BILA|nr:hypothetical protein A3Q56_06344 [Intoshia linei]
MPCLVPPVQWLHQTKITKNNINVNVFKKSNKHLYKISVDTLEHTLKKYASIFSDKPSKCSFVQHNTTKN